MIIKCKLLFLSVSIFLIESIKYLYHKDKDIAFINFVEILSKFNIFYIKLFQSIGTNTKIFNNVQREYLLQYLDYVPCSTTNIQYNIMRDIIEVGNQNGELILDTSNLCYINSGMIAIVYKTTMLNNDVVLKIKKKNINKKVYAALEEVELIINLLSFLPYFEFFYLKDLFLESKILLRNQLDFNMEISNLKNFYNNNKNTDYVKIPYVYDKFTLKNSNMIVMEYLNGTGFNKLEEKNKVDYSKLIAKFSLKSLLFNRIFHADLHGGNIIFMEENNNKKLGIIDFGVVGNITREEQDIYYNFINELFINNDYKTAAGMIGKFTTKIYKNKISIIETNSFDEIEVIIKEGTRYGTDLDFYNSYNINKALKKCNFKLSPSFYKLQYSIGTGYSVCMNLSTNEPFLNNISDACKDLTNILD